MATCRLVCGLLALATRAKSLAPPVAQNDLAAWQALHDATGGTSSWRTCRGDRDAPCDCDLVDCETRNDELRVLNLGLRDNGLVGTLRGELVEAFESLQAFDVRENPGLDVGGPWGAAPACLDAPACAAAALDCLLPGHWTLCADTELQTWRQLYDDTGGAAWTECAAHRDTPCACGQVVCEYAEAALTGPGPLQPTHIARIVLPDNGMVGLLPDLTGALARLSKLRLGGNSFTNSFTINRYQCADILNRCAPGGGADCGDGGELGAAFQATTPCFLAELGAWRELFDALHENGPWTTRCEDERDNPCECLDCRSGKVQAISMPQGNLAGAVPAAALARFSEMHTLDLDQNDMLRLAPADANRGCLPVPRCHDGSATCTFSGDLAGVATCAPVPGPGPSSEPDAGVVENDLFVWQSLFDATGGPAWNQCADTREQPCACAINDRRFVTCSDRRIVSIKLQQNRLQLDNLSFPLLRTLPALEELRLDNVGTSNLNAFAAPEDTACVSLPECGQGGRLECALPMEAPAVAWCHDTPAPTLAPSPAPTGGPTPMPTLAFDNQRAWVALFDYTGGANWTYCSDLREAPCLCKASARRKVECDDEGHIVKIRLMNNNLQAALLPEFRLADLRHLVALELDNADDLQDGAPNRFTGYGTGYGPDCVALDRCDQDNVTCAVAGALLCHETAPPTPPPSASPTPTTGVIVHADDLAFWHALYDATGGDTWTVHAMAPGCSRTDPCACSEPATLRFVACAGGRITDIVLPDNNMSGPFPDPALLARMTALKRLLVHSSLGTSSPNTFTNPTCLAIPECDQTFTKTCRFDRTGLSYCTGYNPTQSPSTRPSRAPSSAAPTSAAPSQAPSRSPSVGPTSAPSASPVGEPQDVYVRMRFVRADFGPKSSSRSMLRALFARAFPQAADLAILDVRRGSVIVDALLGNYTGPALSSGAAAQIRVAAAMTASERELLKPDQVVVHLSTGEPLPEAPTAAPSSEAAPSAAPVGAATVPLTSAPTTSPTAPLPGVGVEQAVGIVFGSVAATTMVSFVVYTNRPRKNTTPQAARRTSLDRRSSWRIDDRHVIEQHDKPLPFQRSGLVSSVPPQKQHEPPESPSSAETASLADLAIADAGKAREEEAVGSVDGSVADDQSARGASCWVGAGLSESESSSYSAGDDRDGDGGSEEDEEDSRRWAGRVSAML